MIVTIERIFKGLYSAVQKSCKPTKKNSLRAEASLLMGSGDYLGATAAFRAHLQSDPGDVFALSDLGICLAGIGDMVGARAVFERTYALDDHYVPVIINYAKLLVDMRCSSDALPLLQRAKVINPNITHVDAVYAGICLSYGNAVHARYFQLRVWLADFDNLRLANGFLFYDAFSSVNEVVLAAEHQFWAETVIPIADAPAANSAFSERQYGKKDRKCSFGSSKLRIGYWSPDFHNHSVRYFFRPLLESHDRTEVELFLYYDSSREDEQTKFLRSACDHFHDVCGLPDADLFALICSHQLDVFVELAGHSSSNRVHLLQQRFATLQISALGYPSTTGLTSVDAKLLDRHVLTSNSSRYYTEAPLALPSSFWCFDPMEDASINAEPPSMRNGYITFGYVGNIAKINRETLICWVEILRSSPNSRLLIRSTSFEDGAAEKAFTAHLLSTGVVSDQLDLRQPEFGSAYFSSYNEIDIVLDTFPFNGGTTTCFATYMGVPVVSRAGDSLLSRMGLSILTNLGVPELAVHDANAYTECAVKLARNPAFLQQFRIEARERFQRTALGNGKLFAREFEDACRGLLDQKHAGTFNYQHTIPPLPADEIIRRAYAVLRYGQTEAAERIVRHCLRHYPNSGSAHLLVTQLWTSENRFAKAVEYLLARLDSFSDPEQASVLIYVTRLYLLLEQTDQAAKIIERLASRVIADQFDRMQVRLYLASITAEKPHCQLFGGITKVRSFHFVIPCNSIERFESMCKQISINCYLPQGWDASYQRCDEEEKIAAYKSALRSRGADVLIFMQKNVTLHNPLFLLEVATVLECSDVLGFAGATRWSRMEWRVDKFECKAAGLIAKSSEKNDFVELQLLGVGVESVIENMAVLDGSLLALVPSRVGDVIFDEDLQGAGLLLEEDWSHSVFKSGCRLAVHRNLGVALDPEVVLNDSNRAVGRVRCSEKMGWNPFAMVKDDNMTLSLALESPARAVVVCQNFMRGVEASQ